MREGLCTTDLGLFHQADGAEHLRRVRGRSILLNDKLCSSMQRITGENSPTRDLGGGTVEASA